MKNTHTESGTRKSADQLSQDRLLELLSAKRRRYVVIHLRKRTSSVAVADLARWIAEWESEQSPIAAQDLQEDVHLSLHHWHIPKLEEAGVVAHNQDRDTVEPAANFERVVELSNSLSKVADPGPA